MSTNVSAQIDLPNEAATQAFAAALSARVRAGDAILLQGPIGAGKSAFARAFIQTLMRAKGTVEDVPSPTFTLVQVYQIGANEIWHADLYRLTEPNEAIELGLDMAFEKAISLIEWPDRLGSQAPENALTLDLAMGANDTARVAHLTWTDPRWHDRLSGLIPAETSLD